MKIYKLARNDTRFRGADLWQWHFKTLKEQHYKHLQWIFTHIYSYKYLGMDFVHNKRLFIIKIYLYNSDLLINLLGKKRSKILNSKIIILRTICINKNVCIYIYIYIYIYTRHIQYTRTNHKKYIIKLHLLASSKNEMDTKSYLAVYIGKRPEYKSIWRHPEWNAFRSHWMS